MTIAKVTIEINRARFELGAAVFNKTAGLGLGASTQQQHACNTAARNEQKRGKHARNIQIKVQKTPGWRATVASKREWRTFSPGI